MAVDENGNWTWDPKNDKTQKVQANRLLKRRKLQASGEFDPNTPHPFMHAFQGVPMLEGMPPASMPPEVANCMAYHIERLGFRQIEDLVEIKHRYRSHEPHMFISPGEWVGIDDNSQPAEQVEVPDLSGTDPKVLAAMKQAIEKAEVAQAKIAQADPQPQADALAAIPDPVTIAEISDPGGTNAG